MLLLQLSILKHTHMIFVIFIFLKKFSPRKRRFRTQGQENGWILKRLRYNRLVAALTTKMLVRIIPFIKHNRLNPYVLKAETFSTNWKKSAKTMTAKLVHTMVVYPAMGGDCSSGVP